MDKNIMKKQEDYIKPVTFEAQIADQKVVDRIRQSFIRQKNLGNLEKTLIKLRRKQKNATTTNGPHPHHA